MLGDAAHPALLQERIRQARVERIVADRDLCSLRVRIDEGIRPVIEVVDLDSATWVKLGCSRARGRQGEHAEVVVVGYEALWTLSAQLQSRGGSLPGRWAP